MRQRKSVALLLLVLLLNSIFDWPAFAALVPNDPDQTAVLVEAQPGARRIGASPAPGAGAFQVVLDTAPEGISRAFLVYELAGVPGWTATVRSINGLPAEGGFGAVPASGAALQVEEINPRWLHQGLNRIVFFPAPAASPAPSAPRNLREQEAAAPEGAVGYTVRNLRILYLAGTAKPAPRLRITHPVKGEGSEDGTVLRGFVEPAALPTGPAELFVNGTYVPGAVSQPDGAFAVFVPRSGAAGAAWEIEVEVVYPDGTRIRRTVAVRPVGGKPDSETPKGEDAEDVATKALSEQAGADTGAVNESSVPLPDAPEGAGFTPNSIQELAKGDPGAEIVQIAPPEGGPTGDARLELPLVVPPGRHGLDPDLAITYDSSSPDGWLGVGWDLRLPSIEVSTLFGVPRYDGTERYLIDGEQLAATSDPSLFVRRAEGPFQRIARKGSGPAGFWWEVTDKDGTRHLYGQSAQARLRDPRTGNTFRWLLERTVDLHGNTVDYTYATDSGSDGEPWVQVYPARIDYTGVNGAGAFYHMVFGLDDGGRPDRISSGRPGFKTYTRHRLATVDVLAGDALVRRYVLRYRVGDFEKSLLESVAVTGEGGEAELYRHTFEYIPMQTEGDGYAGFADQQAWGGMRGASGFSKSSHIGGGAHAFAGLGPPECQPHAGVQAGGGGTDTTVSVRFLDVNGDGLPDRLNDGGDVDLNAYDPAADPAGTGAGRFDAASFPGATTLEHTSEWSLDVGVGAHLELGITAILGTSWVWNHSNDDHAVADVNGDGRPDLVSTADGFAVRVNDGRSFQARADWNGFSSGGLTLGNPEEEEDVKEGFPLADALRQLVLPFAGRVNLSGAIQKKAAGGDGVKAAIYRNGARIWQRDFGPSDTAACVPGPGDSCGGGLALDVNAGDSLYFLADSKRETSADALLWAPVVSYDGGDSGALEPYGARVYLFDAAKDFRLAGYKGASWASPAAGTVRLTGPIVKQETSDDVVVTVSRSRDLLSPVYTRRLGASETGTFDEVPPIEVRKGEALFLRVSSATPVDSARVQWTPTVAFEGATDPADLPDELLTQKARVLFAVPRLLPADDPTRSWIAPSTGEKAFAVAWDPRGTSGAVLYVQGVNRLWDKRELPASKASFSVQVNAAGGEPVFFTLLVPSSGAGGELKIDDGSIPVNRRYPSAADQNVLSGGFHGWYYGDWNGGVPFSPSGLKPPADEHAEVDFVPGVPHWEGASGFGEPAWVASGFDLYLAAEGVKPSRQGANAAGILDQASGAAPGGGLSVLRKTSGKTWSAEAGAGVSFSLSLADNKTDLDLLDMNGDRYPDQVSGSGVRFSNGRDGFGGLEGFPGLDSAVRESEDGNVSTTIGLGVNFSKKDGGGKALAVLSTLPSVGNTVSLTQTKYDLVDVNGDGLPDRVSMEPGSGAVTVRLNLGYRFGAPESWSLPKWSASSDDRCRDVVDTISSGIAGITGLDTLDGLSFTRSSALHAGVAIGPFGGGAVTSLARTLVELADVNGDGLPDHVSKEQGEGFFRVKLNLGDRWDAERRWYVPDWRTSIGDGYNPLGIFTCLDAVSFNGNVEGNGSVGAPICIPLIPPTPVVGLQIELSGQVFGGQGGMQLFFEDIDGDGLADHVLKKAGDGNVYVKRNQAGRVNLLSAVHRPLGSTLQLAYERRGNHPDMPYSQWVMTGVTVDDGRGNAYPTRYEYGNDARYDRAERESYGFPHLKAIQPDGSTIERWFHNQDLYSRFLPTRTEIADAAGKLFRAEAFTYQEVPVGGSSLARFPARTQASTFVYEGTGAARKTTVQTWSYDALGNVVAFADTADEGTADDVVATLGYHADPDAYVFKPARIEMRDGAGKLLRRRSVTYDAQAEPVRSEETLIGGKDPRTGSAWDGSRNAVTTFTYDELGNLASSTDPSGYARTFLYDGVARAYPVEVRDSFGYVTRYAYDLKYGQPAATTDENGNTVRRAYDAFGRLARVIGPYDTDAAPTLTFEYNPAARPAWAVVHHKDATRPDPIDSAVFIDGLERILQTQQDAELDLGAGNTTRTGLRVSGRLGFDARGRVASEGQPVFADGPAGRFVDVPAKNPTLYAYDVLDRVREVRYPHGAAARVEYGFAALDGVDRLLRTETDPNGRATRFFRDLDENVLGVEQRNAGRPLVTRYAYDALGELTAVTDAKGNVTRLEYDTLGRTVLVDNPDSGRTEYRFEPAGDLGAKITANLAARGQQVRYLRTFHRLDRIDYPVSPDVAYTYGAPGAPANRANRVASVMDASGVEERSYGKLGEVVETVKTATALNGASPKGPFVSRFQLDTFGRLLSVVYPDGETLTYGYDAGGQVKTATGLLAGVRFDYLRHLGYDEFGDRVRQVLGNGVETRYAFDPQSRFLAGLRTTGGGRDLQNLAYGRDLTGTVQAIQNNLPVPAPSLYGGPATQTFQYDDLYQLVGSQGTYRSGPDKTSAYTLAFAYDDLGNITAKNQLHQTGNGGKLNTEKKTTYSQAYAYAGPRPHAPTRIGDRAFRYDLDGNQTGWDQDQGGARRTLTWDEEDRLASVADNGKTTRFLYDAGGTRTNKAGQNGETLYVNRWYSLRNGAIASKHVFADGLRIASKVSPDPVPPSEKAYFFQADHLGSTNLVTDEAGKVFQHLEYFASGEVWVDERSEIQRTPYLFSGKELDDETGLSYFGFRYYDPRQSQWINPDPILDEMLDARKLKARPSASPFHLPGLVYGYVANDPLNNVDPDGLAIGDNRRQGRQFENLVRRKLRSAQNSGRIRSWAEQLTVQVATPTGNVITRLDFVIVTRGGTRVILEAKSSDTAPMTPNQRRAFPTIRNTGYRRNGHNIGPTAIATVRPRTFANGGGAWTRILNM